MLVRTISSLDLRISWSQQKQGFMMKCENSLSNLINFNFLETHHSDLKIHVESNSSTEEPST